MNTNYMSTIKILKISLLSLLYCTSCTGQDDSNMDKLIKAVIEQDKRFLKKNLTSENINIIYDFSVIHTMNVHLGDGTERSDFYHEDEKGTLLHLTAWYNLPISAKILLEKGADINAKDEEGRTPLEVAANHYNITYPVQRVLIENKANMNFYVHKHFLNEPLLFCYIHWRQFEMAELAIENGADVNMKTKGYGDSMLEFAERRGTPELVSKFKAKGAKYSEKHLREREQEREQERLYQEYISQKKVEEAEADRKNQENFESVLDRVIIRVGSKVEEEKNRQKKE